MIGWLARDARRATQQLYRLAKRWPLHTAGAALALLVCVTLKPTWGVPLALTVWVTTVPTRLMWRPRIRVALKDAGLTDPAPPHIQPGTLKHEPYGMSATLTLKRGQHTGDIHTRAPTIAAHLNVRDVTVEPHPDHKGHALLDVVERLPWTPGELVAPPWAAATQLSVWDPLPVALNMRLEPVAWQLAVPGSGGVGCLVGGVPGSGKSVFTHQPTAAGVLDPDCTVDILDGKHAEMWVWHDKVRDYVGFDVPHAVAVLTDVDRWVDQRLEWLAAHGRRVAQPGEPTRLLICDEWATYTGSLDRETADRFNQLALRVVQRGRAAGFIGVFGTQKAASDVIPTAVRDLLTHRAAFRTMTPQASDMALGQGMASRGYSAVDIPPEQRGVGWFSPAGETPRMCKSYALTDEQLQVLAGHAPTPAEPAEAVSEPRHLRPVPDNDREAIRAPRT